MFISDSIKAIPLPVYLLASSPTTIASYAVLVQRQPMKVNGMGVTTGVENPADALLLLQLDYFNNTWTLDHVEDLAGNTLAFALSGAVPGQPGWSYASERIWIYDVFLDTVANSTSHSLNLGSFDWDDVNIALVSNSGDYELEFHAFNSSGDAYSIRRTVSIP